MMKRIFAGLLILGSIAVAAIAGGPITLEVYGPLTGTGSSVLLPPSGIRTLPSWSGTNTITAGSLWSAANGKSYLAMRSGVATNSPTNLVVGFTDAMLWRPVTGTSIERRGLVIDNYSTNHVYLAIGQPAVVGAGIHLAPLTGRFQIDVGAPQEAIHAISSGTNATLCAQDWP